MATKCVIVVNWNSGPYLRKCLRAVLNQSVPIEKIIVVDNASTDASLLVTEDLLPQVQLIQLTHNAGFAAGNNLAVKVADGCEWIAFLNPDAFPEPDWLERLRAFKFDAGVSLLKFGDIRRRARHARDRIYYRAVHGV
jgi:GT2 family glycosyltransferase